MDLKIRDDRPLMPPKRGRRRGLTDQLRQLRVGQSAFVAGGKVSSRLVLINNEGGPTKLVGRRGEEDGVKGTFVFCVARE